MKFSKFAKVIKELCDEGPLQCVEYKVRKGHKFKHSDIAAVRYTIADHDYFAAYYLTTEDSESGNADEKSRETVIRIMPMIFYSRIERYVKDYIEDENSEGSLNDAYGYVIERVLDDSDNELGVPVADIKDEAHLRELIMNTNQNLAKIKEYVAAQLLEAQVKAL